MEDDLATRDELIVRRFVRIDIEPRREIWYGLAEIGETMGLATKWLRILSLGGIDKLHNHLVANPIVRYNNNKIGLFDSLE